jgi:hypothetical protein
MSDLSESDLVLLSIYVNPLTGYFKEEFLQFYIPFIDPLT